VGDFFKRLEVFEGGWMSDAEEGLGTKEVGSVREGVERVRGLVK
jgi:hypothetical protein